MSNYTQGQLDALRAAYASGALTVEYQGRRVTYRSQEQLAQAITALEADVGGTPARRRSSVVEYDSR